MNKSLLLRTCALIAMPVVAAGIAFPTAAIAQETAATITGQVVSGATPVPNASLVITHGPSGTTNRVVSDSQGNFSANGLRVGGPYTVAVTASGFENATITEINLTAGEPLILPVEMTAASTSAPDIVVTGSRAGARERSTGPITALGRTQIEGVASVNRDIRDLARRDPLVTMDLTNNRAIEIAGNNGRLNRFSVDGVQMSDDFGLNNGGLPTSRGPVPFDAIEQFSVKTAPYDIAEGDFQGGAINVVLRSGTNRFRGSAFYSYTDETLTGDTVRDTTADFDLSSKQYGGLLAGPIIPGKLFFMVAYEKAKDSFPYDSGVGSGVFNQVPLITQANIDTVSSIAQSVYDYDTMGFQPNEREDDEKVIAKVDWNVTDNHRAAVTFIRNLSSYQVQQNTFLTPTYAIGLQSNAYETVEEINTGTFELNSNWASNFSTTLRASYRDYNRDQDPIGGRSIANFEVCLDATSAGSATSCNTARVFFGPDVSRHTNLLRTSNTSVDFTARLNAGSHAFRYMLGYTDVDTYNLFIQRSLGDLYFDSLTDFQNQRANRFRLGGAVPTLDPVDAAADFRTRNYTVGFQDDWRAMDNLDLSLGVRYDFFDNNVVPTINPNYVARYGFTNQSTFSGRSVLQPRFGFNWEPTSRMIVKGGIGIFAGGTPDVYLSNSFANTGLLTNQIDISRNTSAAGCNVTGPNAAAICNAALNNVTGANYSSVLFDYLTTNVGSLALSPTDAIDPNLKLARKMKTSLQVDYDADLGPLGDGWLFGAQLLFDKNIYGYQWTDIRSVPTGTTLPDGRPRYQAVNGLSTTLRDLLMTNTKKGRGYFGTLRFAKRWDMGLSIDGSYTRSDVKDVANLTSSTASSNYQNNVFVDPNFAAYGRSIYEYTHQYKFGADFRKAFLGNAFTRIGLFGEYRSGRPYSLTMLENVGGRGAVFGTVGNLGKMLLYVPTVGDSKVSFDSAATEAAFNAQVDALGLDDFRGSIIPKNSQTSPDFFKVDVHLGQEIPAPLFDGAKFELFADIENVLNLIDSDWGALRQVPFDYTSTLVRVSCLTTAVPTGTAPTTAQVTANSGQACAQYRYSSVVQPGEVLQTRQSLFGIRVGVRVKF